MANLILGPIIGGLSHERVNLWARADRASEMVAWLGTKADGSDAKRVGKTQLKAVNGYAGIVTVKGLKANKRYFFALSLNPKLPPPESAYQSFDTFPAPGKAQSFRFGFGSCFRPKENEPGLTFKHIRESQKDIRFLLMLGDQIYADVAETNGLGRIPLNVNDYRKVYETTWKNPHHRALLTQTPAFMILDDHEIDNDWHWTDKRFQTTDISTLTRILRWLSGRPKEQLHLSATRARAGLKANWEHQAIHAPAILSPNGPLAYEFEFGKAAFFIMDTRTQRVQNGQDTQLLGEKQWKILETWLLRVNHTYTAKFIISSISVLTDFLVDPTGDRWGGFRHERERLLGFIAKHGIKGIHFLVGDLHSAHAVSADVIAENGEPFQIKQFCSSPFEQKTSFWTLAFDWPANSKFLKNKKTHFAVAKNNYGIVSVDFTDKKSPKVTFDLHYKDGKIWKVKSG